MFRRFIAAALLTGVGCATSSEDVVATPCATTKCLDASSNRDVEPTDSALDVTIETSVLDTAEIPGETAPIDAIFMFEDTSPAPMCDGGGSYCPTGCEDLTKDLANCGACGKACPPAANGTATCSAGKCGFTCKVGFANCDATAMTGCETSLQTDESNCGACAKKCLAGQTCTAGICNTPTVAIETFETGIWPTSPWAGSGGSASGLSSPACAHDGIRGYSAPLSNPIHYYRTDVSVGAAGTKLSAWIQPGSGRVYLGFGATASGAYSFIAAPNTGQMMIEKEIPYGTYVPLATKSRAWAAGVWQKMEITFGAGGSVTGTLYGADGTTVLDTLATTIVGFTPGGVALRAFGSGTCVDTLQR